MENEVNYITNAIVFSYERYKQTVSLIKKIKITEQIRKHNSNEYCIQKPFIKLEQGDKNIFNEFATYKVNDYISLLTKKTQELELKKTNTND